MKVFKNDFFEYWHCIVPYGVNNDRHKVLEIRKWCSENFEKGKWGVEDLHNKSNFVFDFEKDATMFVLRWS
jgi:hypothetical protein